MFSSGFEVNHKSTEFAFSSKYSLVCSSKAVSYIHRATTKGQAPHEVFLKKGVPFQIDLATNFKKLSTSCVNLKNGYFNSLDF